MIKSVNVKKGFSLSGTGWAAGLVCGLMTSQMAFAADRLVIEFNHDDALATEDTSRVWAYVEDDDGFKHAYDGVIKWSADNPNVASIGDNGYLSGNNPGTTTIKAVAPDLGLEAVRAVEVSNQPIEVLIDAPDNWDRAHIWYWYLDGNADVSGFGANGEQLNAVQPTNFGSWPGPAMEAVPGEDGWYRFEIPNIASSALSVFDLERQPARIIFNNPSRGEQTRAMLHYDGCFLSYNKYLGDPANRVIDGRWDSPLDCSRFPKKARLDTAPQGGPLFDEQNAVTLKMIGEDAAEVRYTINGQKPTSTTGTLLNLEEPLVWLNRADFDSLEEEIEVCFYVTTVTAKQMQQCRSFYFAETEKELKLGIDVSEEETTFTIWSPDRNRVAIWLEGQIIPLGYIGNQTDILGGWSVTVPGNHHLKRYHYIIDDKVIRDPNAIMTEPGTDYNIVLDVEQIEPEGGWAPLPELKKREDSIVYEVNIRDFSIDASSGVATQLRGTYLGAVQAGTYLNKGQEDANPDLSTTIDHLKELGITHVQLLPVFDFATCSAKDRLDGPDCYNWGYDPENYNIPEENFSAKPYDYVYRVREFQTMVNEFHKAGIRVIMDVVYNHTWVRPWREADDGERYLGPITGQYFLKDAEGFGFQLTGTGNTLNGNHPLVSRYIRESLEHWVKTYGIDGFRFDLAGVFNYSDIAEWMDYLEKKFPERNLVGYGEPYVALEDNDPNHFRLWNVRFMNGETQFAREFGGFNTTFRSSIKGNNDDGEGGGFAFNQIGDMGPIVNGLRGSIGDSGVEFSSFAGDPSQTVNYVSSHDNLTLFDKIEYWAGIQGFDVSFDYKKRISVFANSIVLAAQGIPMLHGGSELLRTKYGDPNTYNAGDFKNKYDWNRKAYFYDVFAGYRDAIKLRRELEGFRLGSADEINRRLQVYDEGFGLVRGAIQPENGKEVLYFLNSGFDRQVNLPAGNWRVRYENAGGADRVVSGSIVAGGTSLTVLVRD